MPGTERGTQVRVDPILESILRDTAKKLGIRPYVLRNFAIAAGLAMIVTNYVKPQGGEDVLKDLSRIKEVVTRILEPYIKPEEAPQPKHGVEATT